MNNTVALVTAWVEFEGRQPQASIEDFCRHMLSSIDTHRRTEGETNCQTDYQNIYALTRIINRLSKLWMHFTLSAMKPMGLTSFDEFAFLYNTNQANSMRKKDLIYMQFIEISSGLLVIDRLIKKGFLQERIDDYDKRSKQVSLTKKGKLTLDKCQIAVGKVAENLYGEMPKEAIELCIHHLEPVEKKIAMQWYALKRFDPVTK
jgi:DNA-binding MarR family transcriptional regulator